MRRLEREYHEERDGERQRTHELVGNQHGIDIDSEQYDSDGHHFLGDRHILRGAVIICQQSVRNRYRRAVRLSGSDADGLRGPGCFVRHCDQGDERLGCR
jgi:hypothetical protein